MPLRDDREAARHRIDALERQLEEERERTHRAEEEARAAKEALDRRAAAPSAGSSRTSTAASPSTSQVDPGPWAPELRRRYVRAVVVAVFALNLPILVLYAGWPHDLDDRDASLLGWSMLPTVVLPLAVYVLARLFHAPFPGSAVMPAFLASGIGWFAVCLGGSDMVWGDVLADPPWRWLTRGPTGLLGIVVFAAAAAHWSAEAVLTRIEPGD